MGEVTQQRRISNVVPGLHARWAVFGMALLLMITARHGITIRSDSVTYLSIANNIVVENEYQAFWGATAAYPPVYPGLLAVGQVIGDAELFALGIHVTLYASALFILSRIFHSQLGGGRLYWLAMILVIASPFSRRATFALTEHIYSLLTIATILLLWQYARRHDTSTLVVLLIMAGVAPLIRYIGIINIAVVIVWIWQTDSRRRLLRGGLCALIGFAASLPIAAWMARNRLATGTLLGERVQSDIPVWENGARAATTITHWFVPAPFVVLVIALIMFAWVAWANRQRIAWLLVAPAALYIVMYTGWLVISSSLYAFDSIDERLLSPIYIPLLVVLMLVIKGATKDREYGRNVQRAALATAALILLWASIYHAAISLRLLTGGDPSAYNTPEWDTAGAYLQDIDFGEQVIYSNRPDALWYVSEGISASPLPARYRNNATEATATNIEDVRWPSEDKATVVAFERRSHTRYSIDELRSIADIIKIDENGIVSIYEARRASRSVRR